MRRALLVLAVLLTSLLVGWVLLAAVLLHSGPTGAQPVILILAVLLAVTGGLKGGQLKQASLDEFLKSTQTTSFIVLKDDAILYEGYANGLTRDSIVQSFSIAKSVTSALVGIAIDEGAIKGVDDPIITYLPELRGKGLDGVTIRHLLTMSSGIGFVHKAELPPLLRPLPLNDDTRTTHNCWE